jgi:predicted regulator of Ras-like GTPase activity (Roadblock/LC7/MglB family)
MTATPQLGWLLDDLVARVPAVDKAAILSRDGLTASASTALGREEAERLSAIAAGFYSLARGAVQEFGADYVRQIIVELDSVFLIVMGAGTGSCLAAVTSVGAELGLVAYEMALLAKRLSEQMEVPQRAVPYGPRGT